MSARAIIDAVQRDRKRGQYDRQAQRGTVRRVLYLSKLLRSKPRGLGEAKPGRIYWRDLGERDKVIATSRGFAVKQQDKQLTLFWHASEAVEAARFLRERVRCRS